MNRTGRYLIYLLLLSIIPEHAATAGEIRLVRKSYFPDIPDTYGVTFRDLDGDERPDLYLVCFRTLNRVLINKGARRAFLDKTIESGLGGHLFPRGIKNLELGAALFDYDNDGDCDVLIAGWGSSTQFFRNEGNLRFKNITEFLNLEGTLDANGAFAADVNNDGWTDIFITDEHSSNRLLLNTGTGEFSDATETSGLGYPGISQSAAFCDVDRDGDADLYVTNWNDRDCFYRNNGNGTFRRVFLPLATLTDSLTGNGISFADIDNDGDSDLFVANRNGISYLFRNDTDIGDSSWQFTNITEAAGLAREGAAYSPTFADFDNDGLVDLFLSQIGPNRVYRNINGQLFKQVQELKSGRRGYSTGTASADFDRDGDIDLVVANKDTFSMMMLNESNSGHFIRFRLQGISANRDAIGSRVELYDPGQPDQVVASGAVRAGDGYLSSSELTVHFGLGEREIVNARIIFPGGTVIQQTGLRADSTYVIAEYGSFSAVFISLARSLSLQVRHLEFWYRALALSLLLASLLLAYLLGNKRYHWSAGTLGSYFSGAFFAILLLVFLLRFFDLTVIFAAASAFSTLLAVLVLAGSERLYRMRRARERYRSILLEFSNRLIDIRSDQELLRDVVSAIHTNTPFDRADILLFDREKKEFSQAIDASDPNLLNLINQQFVTAEITSGWQPVNEPSLAVQMVFHIRRGENRYGLLALGSVNGLQPLPPEDINLFVVLCQQLAIALENNAWIRQSNEYVRQLTEASVREEYLQQLETSNRKLDMQNKELQRIYDELRQTQSQLIHSEKMAGLGQLVAGISHEMNNPVGFIYANTQQLQKYVEKITAAGTTNPAVMNDLMPDIRAILNETLSGSRILRDLISNLRKFSHLDQAEEKPADPTDGIDSALMILRPLLKDRITVHKSYQTHQYISCHPGQLNQVYMNILANAAQAISGNGNIFVSTQIVNNQYVIDIQDDGPGITSDVMGKIFDPFFTTKDVGQGTGLGLSISYSIIRNHGGNITVQNRDEGGAHFVITLPLTGPGSSEIINGST
jgi:signal transduction histidine kinase